MVLSTNELLLPPSPCLSSFSLCLAVTLSMNTSHVLLNSCQPCKILVTKLAGISVITMPGAGVVASKVRKQREENKKQEKEVRRCDWLTIEKKSCHIREMQMNCFFPDFGVSFNWTRESCSPQKECSGMCDGKNETIPETILYSQRH